MLELEQRGGTTWEQCGVESNVCRLEPVWRLAEVIYVVGVCRELNPGFVGWLEGCTKRECG
jgi:hypothetical protein